MEASNFDSLETGFGERAAVEFANLSSIYVPWKKRGRKRDWESLWKFSWCREIKCTTQILYKMMLKKNVKLQCYWDLCGSILSRRNPHLRSILPWVLRISLQEKTPSIQILSSVVAFTRLATKKDKKARFSFCISLKEQETQHISATFCLEITKYQLPNLKTEKVCPTAIDPQLGFFA